MVHLGAWLIQQRTLRPALPYTNAEFCLIISSRLPTHVTDVVAKAADRRPDLTADGHIAAEDVTNLRIRLRHPAIAATYYPIELLWEPPGGTIAAVPERRRQATNPHYARITEPRQKKFKPVGRRHRVVI
jgi:hypothetical protein